MLRKHTLQTALGVSPSLFLAVDGKFSTSLVEPRKWHHVPVGVESAALTGLSWQKSSLGTSGCTEDRKKSVWRLCFLSSCSSRLPLLAHQPFSDVWNSPLTCVSFFCPECRARGRGRKFSKLVVIQRRIIVLARSSSTEPHLYFTCRFAAYTWTCALVLFQSYLICMYALFISLFSALTIENKLTFLGFIFVFSKPVEKTWRRTQEVRPYSQAVNPRRWPYRPFLSPPSILLLLCSPSPIHLVPPGLETPKLPPSLSPSLFHWTPLQLEWGRHKLCQRRLTFIQPAVAHTALHFMWRHVGCLLLSICFNYVLIACRPLLNACLLFLSARCEILAVDCDSLHYLNWW